MPGNRLQSVVAIGMLFMFQCVAFGLQADVKDRLPGHWELSHEKTKSYLVEREKIEGSSDDFLEDLPRSSVEFQATGHFKGADELDGTLRKYAGEWELTSVEDENHATMEITYRDENSESRQTIVLHFIDDDTFAMTINDEPTIVYARVDDES